MKRIVLFLIMVLFLFQSCGKENKVQENNSIINVWSQEEIDSIDPHKSISAGTNQYLFNVYEGLIKIDENLQIKNQIAKDIQINENYDEFIFTLKDVKFHNGKTVTPEDVVYSIKRVSGFLKEEGIRVKSELKNNIKDIFEENGKVVIKLNNSNDEFLYYMNVPIIPESTDKNTEFIGTGPYKIKEYKPLNYLKLDINDEYYDEKAKNNVNILMTTNMDAAIMNVKEGDVDLIPYLTFSQTKVLNNKMNIEVGNLNLIQSLYFNNNVKPFNDKRVREAISRMINEEEIIDILSDGKATKVGHDLYFANKEISDKNRQNIKDYDIKKAKELLKKAGYEKGLEFTIKVPNNYKYHIDTATIIQNQLKEFGVKANIELIEWSSWLENVYNNRKYQATIIALDNKLAPKDTIDRFYSKAPNNFIEFKNTEFDKNYEKLSKKNSDEKIEIYRKLEDILMSEYFSKPIQSPPQFTAVGKNIENYVFYPMYVQDFSKMLKDKNEK